MKRYYNISLKNKKYNKIKNIKLLSKLLNKNYRFYKNIQESPKNTLNKY